MPTIRTIFTNRNLFVFGLVLVIVGMPMSAFLMSVGQIVLAGNWIIEGDWKRKWQLIKTSKVLWVMVSFYLLHLVGLLWTSDFDYAMNDLRIKMPLLWFPLLFITSKQKLSKKEVEVLLWLFTLAVFVTAIISTLVWLGLTKHKVVDIRDISIFNSHIRFALMIVFVICFLIHNYFKSGKWFWFLIKAILVAWFVAFLGIMQSYTGIAVLFVVLMYKALVFLKQLKKPVLRLSAFAIISMILLFFVYSIIKEVKEQRIPIKPVVMMQHTPAGHIYYNDPNSLEAENGNLIWVNICTYELQKEWNRKSEIKFDEKDKKGNDIATTLIRYLSSRGLTKDSVGISKLSLKDILWIQKGKSNYLYTNKSGIETRIYETIYELNAYKTGKNPTGYSLLMRLEFWKNGIEIIKRKWLYGVGTGDNQRAYNNQYTSSASKLKPNWRLRSHNQFMATTISFGVIGLVIFLVYLCYPAIRTKNRHYLFTSFFIIYICSMFNEDTLETQAGVTFFGFFYCFLLLQDEETIKRKA